MSEEQNPSGQTKPISSDEVYRKYKDSYASPEPKEKNTNMPSTTYSRYESHREAGEIEGDVGHGHGEKHGHARHSSYSDTRHRYVIRG